MHIWYYPILASLFGPLVFLFTKTLNNLALSLPDEGNSRNASYALNVISTLLLYHCVECLWLTHASLVIVINPRIIGYCDQPTHHWLLWSTHASLVIFEFVFLVVCFGVIFQLFNSLLRILISIWRIVAFIFCRIQK